MVLLAAMKAAVIAETVGSARVIYVDQLGIRPRSVLRATSHKLCASFPERKICFKSHLDVYPGHHLVMLLKMLTISMIIWLLDSNEQVY